MENFQDRIVCHSLFVPAYDVEVLEVFDPAVNNQCREPQAEWIVEKERRNFCDYFSLTEKPAVRKAGKDDLNDKWKKLFGGGSKEPGSS